MRRLIVIVIMGVIVAALCAPALAGGGPPDPYAPSQPPSYYGPGSDQDPWDDQQKDGGLFSIDRFDFLGFMSFGFIHWYPSSISIKRETFDEQNNLKSAELDSNEVTREVHRKNR